MKFHSTSRAVRAIAAVLTASLLIPALADSSTLLKVENFF